MRTAVIGGGASGLMVAGLLAKKGLDVTIFDGNEKVGKKLYITGKGRCNLTNLCNEQEFLGNVVNGEKFLRSAIYAFPPSKCVEFFTELGLDTKVERGKRVFPQSDKSSDVIKALTKHCQNVNFMLNSKVDAVWKENEKFFVKCGKNKLCFDNLIIATGGKSYHATGSTGDGYSFAKSFGHTVTTPRPALCPIKLGDDVSSLQGLSLKNVSLLATFDGKKKSFFGEMLFTDIGISGPIVLSMSSFINRAQNVTLSLDLKPALELEKVKARLLRDFDENKNKNLTYVLKGLMPSSLVPFFASVCGVSVDKKVHDITKAEREKIATMLKNLPLKYGGLYDIDAGIITSGGVSLKEINPKTFESKLVKNLYFIGEVLDLDALTGGFNLQIAFATAYSCALNFAENA